jgi:transposase
MRVAPSIALTEGNRDQLKKYARGYKTPVRLMLRARIVLRAADGLENREIAEELGLARATVGKWRTRFAAKGMEGILTDAPRSGRKPKVVAAKVREVIRLTTQETPAAATHWSRRTMAAVTGLSPSTVGRIWKQHGLKPHLRRTFKVSNDPQFAEKLEDVVGLYLNPPEHAIVFAADEKSQIQALDRTQPGLPLKKGRCGTMTHDYKRNGTTTLFAALNILDGSVIGTCMPRHRHQEWLKFLRLLDRETPREKDIHLIVDNYTTHKHATVKRWLARHPRFHIHFTPTSASWLNMVERFFRDLTSNQLRRGTFASVTDLTNAITDYINHHNSEPKPFVWHKNASDILGKVTRARRALNKATSV